MSDSLYDKDIAFKLNRGDNQHLKTQKTLNHLSPIAINGSKIPDISTFQKNSLGTKPKPRSVSCLPKTSLLFVKDELSYSARKSAKNVKIPAYKSYKKNYLHPCVQQSKLSTVWKPITDNFPTSNKEASKSNDIQKQEGLHLDRCGLKTLPQVINSDQFTVLSCRQNFMSHIPDLSYLQQLIKLDLSDNRIEHISGLEKLSALRVLNLSENRVQKISGLDSLFCLEILDLHKNQINKISGIQNLHHLKKLNLAYNQLIHMENLSGFQYLHHLNLNHNCISFVGSLIQLPSLKKLYLENNKIKRFDDVTKLFEASHLQELALRGNPITLLPYYFETICNYLPDLQILDFASVKDHFTEMELQTFMENMESNANKMPPSLPSIFTQIPRWRDKTCTNDHGEEDQSSFLSPSRRFSAAKSDSACTNTAKRNPSQQNEKSYNISISPSSSNAVSCHLDSQNTIGLLRPPVPFIILENRDLAHNPLDEPVQRTNFIQDERNTTLPPFLKRSAIFMSADNSKYDITTSKPLVSSQTQTNLLPLQNVKSSSTSATASLSQSASNSRNNNAAAVNAQPTNLTKILSSSSRIEVSGGTLTLKGIEALSTLETLNIQGSQISIIIITDIDFEKIISYLHSFHMGFPFLQTIELHHTNIGTFRQLDALVQVRNLENLLIGPDNPIVHLSSWMLYLVHRMAHLHLKTVNGKQVTVEMHQAASQMFGPVMQLMRSTFQKRRLSTILSEAQGHHTLLQSKEENPPDDFDQQTNDCGLFSITNCSVKEAQVNVKTDEISQAFVEEMLTKSFHSLWKQRLFHLIWPSVLSEIIVETLLDFRDIDSHVKESLDNLKKYASCNEVEL